MAAQPELIVRRRHLPHWTLQGSTYFATFRLAGGELAAPERRIVIDHLTHGDPEFYTLIAAVVMPDHVHVLLRPNESIELSRVMKGVKGVSARLLNAHRGRRGRVWQAESFDRIVRDHAELDEKLHYMLNNPVKAGLVSDGWKYDGWLCCERT